MVKLILKAALFIPLPTLGHIPTEPVAGSKLLVVVAICAEVVPVCNLETSMSIIIQPSASRLLPRGVPAPSLAIQIFETVI